MPKATQLISKRKWKQIPSSDSISKARPRVPSIIRVSKVLDKNSNSESNKKPRSLGREIFFLKKKKVEIQQNSKINKVSKGFTRTITAFFVTGWKHRAITLMSEIYLEVTLFAKAIIFHFYNCYTLISNKALNI